MRLLTIIPMKSAPWSKWITSLKINVFPKWSKASVIFKTFSWSRQLKLQILECQTRDTEVIKTRSWKLGLSGAQMGFARVFEVANHNLELWNLEVQDEATKMNIFD